MKLVYLSHWRFPAEKTHAQFAMKTCEAFASEGIETELWIPTRENPLKEDPYSYHHVKNNFRIRQIPVIDIMHISSRIGFPIMVVQYAWKIVRKAKKERDTIFYAHDARDLFFLIGKVNNILLEIHDFYESRFSFISKKVFPKITGFVVTNSIKVKYLSEKYGIPKEKLLHQPNAVDVDKFDIRISKEEARNKLSLPEGNIILYLGTLYKWKGVYTLAEAAKTINGTVYFLGGPEEEQTKLEEFIETNKLTNLKFLKRQPHELMPFFMKAADVLVLPNTGKDNASKYETSPVKLFEYLVSKTPIVASRLPSIEDIVSGDHVIFAEPDNPKSFSMEINNVLKDSGSYEKKSLEGFKHVQQFTWKNRSGNIIAFIRGHLS